MTIKIRTAAVGSHTHLAGLEEVKANVGVTRGGIHTVLTEVFADIFWSGLGQQTVNAFPKPEKQFNYQMQHIIIPCNVKAEPC